MDCSVYWIRKADQTDMTREGYIGVSTNVRERFGCYQRMDSKVNKYLCNVIKKHGWDNLVKSVLLVADKEYCLDIERKLRPHKQIGWNLAPGGGYPPINRGPRPALRGRVSWHKGKKGMYSEATLEKMRQAKLGKPSWNKGIPITPEHLEKLRQSNIGVKRRLGKKMPAHVVEMHRQRLLGTKLSDETRAKMSESQKKRKRPPFTEEHKKNLGNNARGKLWYNNGKNVVFCFEGQQPDGYVRGRGSPKFVKENHLV